MMKLTRHIFLLLMLTGVAVPMAAQKKKQTNQVTPQNAKDQDKVNLEKKQAEYKGKKDYHHKAQDKATKKRMKKNLKRSQKHSWGKEVPWYKRWFRKGKV